eukprot:1383150-Amorphochlora_amoeboformis.AAC.2
MAVSMLLGFIFGVFFSVGFVILVSDVAIGRDIKRDSRYRWGVRLPPLKGRRLVAVVCTTPT